MDSDTTRQLLGIASDDARDERGAELFKAWYAHTGGRWGSQGYDGPTLEPNLRVWMTAMVDFDLLVWYLFEFRLTGVDPNDEVRDFMAVRWERTHNLFTPFDEWDWFTGCEYLWYQQPAEVFSNGYSPSSALTWFMGMIVNEA